jgi:hypothetical protein
VLFTPAAKGVAAGDKKGGSCHKSNCQPNSFDHMILQSLQYAVVGSIRFNHEWAKVAN